MLLQTTCSKIEEGTINKTLIIAIFRKNGIELKNNKS